MWIICDPASLRSGSVIVAGRLPESPNAAARPIVSAPAGARRIWLVNQADTHMQRTGAIRFCEEVLACGSMADIVAVGSLQSGDDLHWRNRSEK